MSDGQEYYDSSSSFTLAPKNITGTPAAVPLRFAAAKLSPLGRGLKLPRRLRFDAVLALELELVADDPDIVL